MSWLEQLTALPTIAGHEGAVVDWIEAWAGRRKDVRIKADPYGNLVLTQRRRTRRAPVWITAHLDHPGFLLTGEITKGRFHYEFRGGVLDPYFDDARIELFTRHGRRNARVETLEHSDRRRVGTVKLIGSGPPASVGDIGRWAFRSDQLGVRSGQLRAPACDDLAGVAAALEAFDRLRSADGASHIGVLLTRAEEVGFIGAIAAATGGTIPEDTRLICVEMSRSFDDSPIGAGPVVRVGDASSVFAPELTGAMTEAAKSLAARRSEFVFQRKLMAGGSCEATAFGAYGFASTCLCLPLGNYHNMANLAQVEVGAGPARVAPEVISVKDYRGLVTLLTASVTQLDNLEGQLRTGLDLHYERHAGVLSD